MISPMASKTLLCKLTTAATNATASASFAADGWSYVSIDVGVISPTADTAGVKLLALAVQEADGTSYAAISGLTGTTNTTAATGEFLIPATQTTTPNIISLGIKNAGRKKNYKIIYEGVTGGATLALTAKGWNGIADPSTASERNSLASVVV